MTAENEQVYIPGHVDKVLLPLWDASNKLFLANFIVNFVKEKFHYTRLVTDMEKLYRKLLEKNAK